MYGVVRGLVCGLLVATSLHTAYGQGTIDKRLVLKVQPKFGVIRGHAPVALSVALSWSAAPLLEGRLQLDWYVDETRLGRHISSDLALSDSTLRFDIMLPPVILPHDEAAFSVQGRFIATDGTLYDLDVHDVALQPDWRRILMVGICTTPGPVVENDSLPAVEAPANPLAGGFRLEPFFESRFTKRELLVDDTEVDPDDAPTDPLQLTAFDLFVVPGESLSRLRPRQLEALLIWVQAGGSLCVFVDSAVPQEHVEWLNQLAGRDLAEAAFLRGADGQVLPADAASGHVMQHHLDFGRVVMILGEPALAEAQWKQAVLFLWKVREDRRLQVQRDRSWRLSSPEIASDFTIPSPLEPQRFSQESELTALLLPDSVQGLPLSTVSVVLVVFLLVIAPGDYLLLGWLKRHRWTWILFPTVSLLCTGTMMWLAHRQLGRTSYERAITVIDVGNQGRPVRTSRFEMLYASSNRTVTSDLEHELMVPLDPVVSRLPRRMLEARAPREYEQAWTFSGRVPVNYSIVRDIQQWSPRMARMTTFGNATADQTGTSGNDPILRLQMTAETTVQLEKATGIPPQIVTLAENLTRRPAHGFFSVISQLSPTCGGNWEDLSVLDSSNHDTTVIVEISKPAEGEFVITRRLQRESN